MTADTQETFVKIHVTFDDPDSIAGESMWAKPTEKHDEFQIENIPFFADDLALGDIVKVTFPDDALPEIVEVVRDGGNATVVAMFKEDAGEEKVLDVVSRAKEMFDCKTERGFETLWAFSVKIENASELWNFLKSTGYLFGPDSSE